ncbi:uncharacterized protein LOC106157840 [Lingula anatina]|uniref:Uncharacterized protein LOC106157840 n=1 Tax=Lingula anatina TaxID=7574 RepID=A0A1S3HSP2_LINAN|nr:uncharacterized protein LOC106157840 [Lingula anatina]XP_013389061.1 uncharacterized protein LOC106157840 [Lingula anatina]|eukprot:XP_013389060.1 uncharacterized protein LOC106157840 [Lingula anatina]
MLIFTLTLLYTLAYNLPGGSAQQTKLNELYQKRFFGEGTYYGQSYNQAKETCQLRSMLPGKLSDYGIDSTAAINIEQFTGSLTCGICLRVTGSGQGLGLNPLTGTYLVYVTDLCPSCKQGDVDFALVGDGRWNIDFTAVPCPFNDNVSYRFQDSSPWYIKIQVGNTRLPVTGMALYNGASKEYVPMMRTNDGFWIMNPSILNRYQRPIQYPLRVQLTSVRGEVLQDTVTGSAKGVVYTGSVQFTSQ